MIKNEKQYECSKEWVEKFEHANRKLQANEEKRLQDPEGWQLLQDLIYNSFFQLDFPTSMLQENSVKMIVYDIELERISQWKD
ncbi:MAG: hypothetical protein PUP91_10525 [Rhizonema sp. PD37]|nr:hypothetical protein [Rhizonema sp. PD37]